MRITFIFLFLLASISLLAQDQSTPQATLQSLFKMARTQDYSQIHKLCDPEKEGDGDVKRICNLMNEPKISKEEIYLNMRLAYILGHAEYRENMARVPFKFGIKCNETEEMVLVKRGAKWYLYSF
jgi:hypothetical protein